MPLIFIRAVRCDARAAERGAWRVAGGVDCTVLLLDLCVSMTMSETESERGKRGIRTRGSF